MGAQASKATDKEREDTAGKGQALQFKFNLWPEPIRKAGTTHDSDEHEKDLKADEWVGHAKGKGHKFDTMVAALNTDEAPKSSRVFVYGMAKYDAEPRPEIIMLKYNEVSEQEVLIRYTDYFAKDSKKLVDPSALDNEALQSANKLVAELTSAPTEPNDDDRKVRMAKSLNKLIGAWKDSDESATKSIGRPWKRKCAGDKLEKAVAEVCGEGCTISMPLQQLVLKAADLPSQWRARLAGKGMFQQFGQTEISMTYEAYAGHHPTGFAQFVIYSCEPSVGHHHISNGILVAEFDKEGNKIEKLVMFRDFLSEEERCTVMKPFV